MTIAYHPHLDRIGEVALVPQLDGRGTVELSRLSPGFVVPGGADAAPLGDTFISRTAIVVQGNGPAGVVAVRESGGMPLHVDGVPVARKRIITTAELNRGVTLTIANRAVFLLHRRQPPNQPPDGLGLVGASDGVAKVRDQLKHVADLNVPVLICGETGTGKELVAQAIHALSQVSAPDAERRPRRGELVALNMGAIPRSLIASELFGHARGAFSGADRPRAGYFEQADGGTLFLDEIGDAPSDVQLMLLRALETGEVRRVGATEARQVDVRVIAATDANLEEAVAQGTFREPLLHRLAGYEVWVPALRERRDDIGRLMLHFLKRELSQVGEEHRITEQPGKALWFPASVGEALLRNPWRGNVRQLRNVVRQIVISGRGADHITLDGPLERLLAQAPSAPSANESVDEALRAPTRDPSKLDAEAVRETLRSQGFAIQKTARALGVSKYALYGLLTRHGIRTAREMDSAEISAALEAHGGDPRAAAEALEVSERALKLRMRELRL